MLSQNVLSTPEPGTSMIEQKSQYKQDRCQEMEPRFHAKPKIEILVLLSTPLTLLGDESPVVQSFPDQIASVQKNLR